MSTANSVVKIGAVEIGNSKKLSIIAGPCQLESRAHAFEMASALKEIAAKAGVSLIYKTSFDKANRTSASGQRGMGLEASLPIFAEIREKFGLPVLTDVHEKEQCAIAAQAVDVLQIPAFLSRQTDLLLAAAAAGGDLLERARHLECVRAALQHARSRDQGERQRVAEARFADRHRGVRFDWHGLHRRRP